MPFKKTVTLYTFLYIFQLLQLYKRTATTSHLPAGLHYNKIMASLALALPRIPWIPILFFFGLLSVTFLDVIIGLGEEWLNDDSMSHGFFVPAVAGYVAWQERHRWLGIELRPNLWGLLLVAWGGFQLVAGTLGAEMFIARTALVVSLVGILLCLGGAGLVRALAFPLFLLLFMIRIPNIIYNQITFPLQLFASQVAEHTLSLLNIPVLREGNILHLASGPLSVVEACSGIRSLLSLSFLSIVYAYLFGEKVWMRGVLLVLTVPIAVATNAFRVTITGLLSNYKRELAEGFLHTAEGWLIFVMATLLLVAAHRMVNFLYHRFYSASKVAD